MNTELENVQTARLRSHARKLCVTSSLFYRPGDFNGSTVDVDFFCSRNALPYFRVRPERIKKA